MKMRHRTTTIARTVTACAIIGAAVAGLAGCASGGSDASASGGDAFADLKAKGSIELGVASVQPSSYVASDGSLTGAEVDTTMEVLKGLGVDTSKIHGTKLDFNAMIPALQARQVDLLSSSLFINSDRCSQVAFSEPVFVGTFAVITLADKYDDASRPATLKDVLDDGLTIGMPSGGAQEKVATDAGIAAESIVKLPNLRGTIDALKAGQIDAALAVGSQVNAALTDDEKSQVTIGDPLADAPVQASAVAFRKTDTALRDAFNEELAKVKETDTWTTIMEKYSVDPELAKQHTTEELCGAPN